MNDLIYINRFLEHIDKIFSPEYFFFNNDKCIFIPLEKNSYLIVDHETREVVFVNYFNVIVAKFHELYLLYDLLYMYFLT